MITVIIKRSYLFPIPDIVKHHKTIITMFEIRKEIVNGVGNVQRSEQVAYVDCSKDVVIKHLATPYYNLARASTLYYKLRGQSYKVRYVFIYKPLIDVVDAAHFAKEEIKARVAEANDYVRVANSAYKESNRKRGLRDKSLELKPVDVKDYLWADKHGVDEAGYVLMVEEDCY